MTDPDGEDVGAGEAAVSTGSVADDAEPSGRRTGGRVVEADPDASTDRPSDTPPADDVVHRRTGTELLVTLPDDPCPRHDCEGVLARAVYKGSPAVVCRSCETPTVRIWGPDA